MCIPWDRLRNASVPHAEGDGLDILRPVRQKVSNLPF